MGKYSDKYSAFYHSSEWKELRKQVMQDNDYLCAECKRNGRIRQAAAVHHKIELEQDYSKRLEWSNLEPLCKTCHNSIHDRKSDIQKFMEDIWNE